MLQWPLHAVLFSQINGKNTREVVAQLSLRGEMFNWLHCNYQISFVVNSRADGQRCATVATQTVSVLRPSTHEILVQDEIQPAALLSLLGLLRPRLSPQELFCRLTVAKMNPLTPLLIQHSSPSTRDSALITSSEAKPLFKNVRESPHYSATVLTSPMPTVSTSHPGHRSHQPS